MLERQQRPQRPVYVLRLRPSSDGDGMRELRAFLKIAWRRFGLKALSVAEEKSEQAMPYMPSSPPTACTFLHWRQNKTRD